MNIYDLADNNPALVLVISIIASCTVSSVFYYIFRSVNRYFRHKNIASKGWPPSHLDGDGDFKYEE